MSRIYGYCRVSTKTQVIDRQVENIAKAYPSAKIITEKFTGTTLERPAWKRLCNQVVEGDTIVFDSVSRMSRSAEEGFDAYEELRKKGVSLIFLKEPYINTDVYEKARNAEVPLTGNDVDLILAGINEYLKKLAEAQIRIAFEQAEKEVQDLRQRTKEGMQAAVKKGARLGQNKGKRIHNTKELKAKKLILEYSADFGGPLKDPQAIRISGVSRNTFYRYKRELMEDGLEPVLRWADDRSKKGDLLTAQEPDGIDKV